MDGDPETTVSPTPINPARVNDVDSAIKKNTDMMVARILGKKPTFIEDHVIERIPLTLGIRNLFDYELEELGEKNRKYLQHNGNITPTVDGGKFSRALIIAATADPPNFWTHPDILNEYKTADNAVSNLILPGEINSLVEHIMKLSGFNEDIKETLKKF